MRSYSGILVAGVLTVGLATTSASAQTAFRIGPSLTAISDGVRGSNSAYDYKDSMYLVVGAMNNLDGVFVLADGGISTPFTIAPPYSQYPGVAYSPDMNGGAGGFLVTWHTSTGPSSAVVQGRMVGVNGGMGPIFGISVDGSWWEAAADIAYSTTSKEFLVVWQGAGIRAQRVGLNGELLGTNFGVTPPTYHRDPAVAYNPTNNQFMVVFGGADASSAFAAFQRVAAGSGALLGPETVLGRAAGVYIAEVAYNSVTNQYLAAWYQGGTVGRLIDSAGNMAANVFLLSTTVTAYDALGIDFNASSGTFMMVSHMSSSFQDGAVEIGGSTGLPFAPIVATDAPAARGNFYPKVTARVAKPEWLLTTATDFSHTTVQRLGSTAAGGGTPPAPPPPPPPPPPTSTATARKADFSSDGKADIVWQRDDGYLSVWTMNGTDMVSAPPLNPGIVDPNWRIAATGDFNGDGKADLVWQDAGGWLAVWYMNGATMIGNELLNPGQIPGNAWKIVGAGDVNGDGKTDLVWQHTDGWLAVWYMSGAAMVATELLNPGQIADNEWKIVGVGDFNGDTKPDLVWQHTSGWLSVWYMNGRNMVGAVYLNPAQVGDTAWKIRAVIDLNGDGKTDLIWQHMAGGSLSAWLMDGINAASIVYLNPSNVSGGWKIMGPR